MFYKLDDASTPKHPRGCFLPLQELTQTFDVALTSTLTSSKSDQFIFGLKITNVQWKSVHQFVIRLANKLYKIQVRMQAQRDAHIHALTDHFTQKHVILHGVFMFLSFIHVSFIVFLCIVFCVCFSPLILIVPAFWHVKDYTIYHLAYDFILVVLFVLFLILLYLYLILLYCIHVSYILWQC